MSLTKQSMYLEISWINRISNSTFFVYIFLIFSKALGKINLVNTPFLAGEFKVPMVLKTSLIFRYFDAPFLAT